MRNSGVLSACLGCLVLLFFQASKKCLTRRNCADCHLPRQW